MIDNVLNKYLNISYQTIEFDRDGVVLKVENAILDIPLGAVIFDFHAEATSEKMCFGHFVDGRASLVVGTHTHMPTAFH